MDLLTDTDTDPPMALTITVLTLAELVEMFLMELHFLTTTTTNISILHRVLARLLHPS
jgi:hypothetical protein